jgi:nucleoside-diphosphate-sugar epimerase
MPDPTLRFPITRGCGFIGTAVVRRLLTSAAHEVVTADNMTCAASEQVVVRLPRRAIRARRHAGQRLGTAA